MRMLSWPFMFVSKNNLVLNELSFQTLRFREYWVSPCFWRTVIFPSWTSNQHPDSSQSDTPSIPDPTGHQYKLILLCFVFMHIETRTIRLIKPKYLILQYPSINWSIKDVYYSSTQRFLCQWPGRIKSNMIIIQYWWSGAIDTPTRSQQRLLSYRQRKKKS